MADLNVALSIVGKDQASGPIGSVQKALGGLAGATGAPVKAFGSLVDILGKVGLAGMGLQTLASSAANLGNALGVGLNSQMENVRAQLMAFTKDGGKTEQILRDIRAEADLTPFSFQAMATAAAALQPAAKQTGQELMGLIKTAEILAASNPFEGLEGASFSLREALSGDFTSIIERFNLSRSSLNQMKAEGVPAMEAVRRAMAEMGLDADLVSSMANTLTGRWSTFNDTLDGFRQRASAQLFDGIKTGLEIATRLIEDNRAAINEWVDRIGSAMGAAAQAVNGFFEMVRNISRDHGLNFFEAAITSLEIKLRETFGDTAGAIFHGFIDYVKWAGGQVSEFVSVVQRALSGDLEGAFHQMVAAVGRNFSDFSAKLQDWGEAFLEWVEPLIPPLLSKLGEIGQAILGWIGQRASDFQSRLGDWIVAFIEWTGEAIPGMLQGLSGFIKALLGGVSAGGSQVAAETGSSWVSAFVGWIATRAVPALVKALPAILGALNDFLAETRAATFAAALRVGEGIVQAIGDAIGNGLAWVGQQLGQVGQMVLQAAADVGARARVVGENIISGIVQGISGGIGRVQVAATGMAQTAITAAMNRLQERSPSKVFEEIGQFVVEGFAIGLSEDLSPVERAAAEMAEKVEDAEREHAIRLSRLWEDAGRAKGKARAAILERIERAEEDHQRKVEQINDSGAARIVQLEREQAQRRGKALAEYGTAVQRLLDETENKSAEIGRRAGDAVRNAISEAGNAINDARSRAGETIQNAVESLGLNRILRGRRDEFSAGQSEESRKRDQLKEDTELEFQFNKEKNKALAEFNRQMHFATEDDDRKAIRRRFELEGRAIDERFKEQRDELARRRQLAEEDRLFRQQQEQARRAFDDTLENEALQRTIARTITERDERIASITQTLAEKQKAIEVQESKERETLKTSFEDKARDLREGLIAKLGPMTAEASSALGGFLDAVATKVSTTSAQIIGQAAAAAAAIATMAGASGAQDTIGNVAETIAKLAPSGLLSSTTGGSSTVATSGGQAAASLLNTATQAQAYLNGWLPSYDKGGTVPGPIGAPQLAFVHGGEEVLRPGQRGGITVHVHVAGSVQTERDLMRSIYNGLSDLQRQGLVH